MDRGNVRSANGQRCRNLRARYNQSRTNASSGNIAWDWDFFYYSANDRLARSIVSPDPMRLDDCVVRMETTYQYDAFGRRIRKVIDLTVESNQACDPLKDKDIIYEYVLDGDAILYERIIEVWGPQNPLTPNQSKVTEALYTRTPSGSAISRRVPTAVPITNSAGRTPHRKSMFYHLNWQNTPIAATDTAGYRFEMSEWAVRSTYITAGGLNEFFRPDGEWFDGDNPIDAGPTSWTMGFRFHRLDQRGALDVENAVGFAGQPYDAETGLSYFHNRYYDSRTGRFTQEDPIGLAGGLNLYAYANNNPVNYTDPYGLCPECLIGWFIGFEIGRSMTPREGADLAVGFVPFVSTLDDAKTGLTGRSLAGTEVGVGGRVLAVLGLVTPVSGGQIRGSITGAKHIISPGLRRVTAALGDGALRRTYRNAIQQINRHKEILQNASPDQINSILKDIRKHEQRLQAAIEELTRRNLSP